VKAPRFAYCRLCGARWVAIPGVIEWHKPSCKLVNPKTGRTLPETPRRMVRE